MDRLKAFFDGDGMDVAVAVQVGAEVDALKAEGEVVEVEGEAHPPFFPGIAEGEEAFGFGGRRAEQLVQVGIAADDAIEDDGVGGRDGVGGGGEVAMDVVDAAVQAEALTDRAGGGDVGG